MSLSNLLLPDASSDKTIYCHNVIADYDSSFTNIDLSGVATCPTAPTLGDHLTNKTYVDSLGAGDVSGPASSTDNAVARFNGTTGKSIQNSTVTIDDNGVITTPRYIKAINLDTVAGTSSTNDFFRGDGSAAPSWIAARFGATTSSDRCVIGNYAGEVTIGCNNDSHTLWRPFYVGSNVSGAPLYLRGIDIQMVATNGVAVSSTLDSSSPLTGSLRLAGGLGVLKNVSIAGNLILGDTTNGHIRSKGNAPTISATHTIQSWSTDVAGQITVAASGTAVVTFATAYTLPQGMTVILTPMTAGAGAYYVSAVSGSSFSVVNAVASPITFMYHVIGCY